MSTMTPHEHIEGNFAKETLPRIAQRKKLLKDSWFKSH